MYLKPNTGPVFCRARPLALALREKVDLELQNLVKYGVLTPVEFSEWATSIVSLLKKNGQVRICGDFKITVNPNLQVDKYPLPKIDHLLAKLNN